MYATSNFSMIRLPPPLASLLLVPKLQLGNKKVAHRATNHNPKVLSWQQGAREAPTMGGQSMNGNHETAFAAVQDRNL